MVEASGYHKEKKDLVITSVAIVNVTLTITIFLFLTKHTIRTVSYTHLTLPTKLEV